MIGFILSLIALFCWSFSDLFSKIGSDQKDKYSHLKMVFFVGLIMGLHAGYSLIFNNVEFRFINIIEYLPASAFYISSMILGYIALRYIELSVSSPICNASGAVAIIFLLIFFKESLNTITTIGVIAVCIGVVLLGVVEYTEDEEIKLKRQDKSNFKYSISLIAILLPVFYCILDAGGTVLDKIILIDELSNTGILSEDAGEVAYELTFLFIGLLSFIYVYLIRKEKLSFKYDSKKLIGGVFETAGQVAYIKVIASDFIAGIPLISSYCAISVLWSRIFLKEKLSVKHYLTIFLTVIGIIVLGISEAIS